MKPKISIITAVFNGASTIGDCVLSVKKQSYSAEHLIIDGRSTDNTVQVARESNPAAKIFSEPDDGIYDAMNKGILLSSGDVVGILNADDFYASADVLEKVATLFEPPSVDCCYGDLLYVQAPPLPSGSRDDENVRYVRYWKAGTFSPGNFYLGWMPPHPTFFVRRSVYERFGLFNTSLGSAADYELMLRFLFRHRLNAAYLPEVMVKMRTGGVSNRHFSNRVKANLMDRRAWAVNGLHPKPWTFLLKPLLKIPQWFNKFPEQTKC